MPSRVVVSCRVCDQVMALLGEQGELRVWEGPGPIPAEDLRAWVADADGLYCVATDWIDRVLLAGARRLRAISSVAVGVDNIDLDACTERGIPVGHTPDVLTDTVADQAVALLLAVARRVVEGASYVRGGRWSRFQFGLLLGTDLHHSTVGIIGMGRIGSAVAERLRAFSTRLVYADPARRPEIERRLGVEHRSLEGLLTEAEHVVVCAPLTRVTHHLIDGPALAKMRPTATLVNVSRGGLVDTEALYQALRDGVIARAALDVTDPEPLPADHPLLALANCVVVPHLGSATRETRLAMSRLAAQNLIEGLAGRRLPACANPEVYQRSRSEA